MQTNDKPNLDATCCLSQMQVYFYILTFLKNMGRFWDKMSQMEVPDCGPMLFINFLDSKN